MIYETTVPADWIDFNGHMRDAYYLLAIARANDAIMAEIGLGEANLARTRRTLYNLECHTWFLKEAYEGDRIGVDMRLLDADRKRLHLYAEIRNADGDLLARNEEVLLHVSQESTTARAVPFSPDVQALVDARLARDASHPAPAPRAGPIGLRK